LSESEKEIKMIKEQSIDNKEIFMTEEKGLKD
jgi:hypothetical protein